VRYRLRSSEGRITAGSGVTKNDVTVNERFPVYVYRDAHFAAAGDTVVTAAPLDLVVSVYGGGGIRGEAGLTAAFNGSILFKNDDTGQYYLGIWGARSASRFRGALRRSGAELEIRREPPPARMAGFQTRHKGSRPLKHIQRVETPPDDETR
jgi:hypothetical protein